MGAWLRALHLAGENDVRAFFEAMAGCRWELVEGLLEEMEAPNRWKSS